MAQTMKKPRQTYRLSNRQSKELLMRGARLWIAIPVPPEASEEIPAMVIAKACMPVHAEYVVSAEYATMPVAIPARTPDNKALGTERVIGRIVEDGSEVPDSPSVMIECVLCELLPPTSAGPRSTIPPKWPGRIFLDDEEITPTATEQTADR